MKYRAIYDCKFRAHDAKGVKRVFELKQGKTMESDREVRFGGLEEVKDVKIKKTKESEI